MSFVRSSASIIPWKLAFSCLTKPTNSVRSGRFLGTQKLRKTFVLRYTYVPDILERRGEFREEHLAAAKEALSEDRLIVGGAYKVLGTNATNMGAHIVFRGEDEQDAMSWAKEFTANDPYVINELVTQWDICEWSVVVGEI
eukprot:m.902223 g.902223  ORF g.902223 m.902223 type:complete len:141 (+) comp23689_c3_seq41:235-657(+)